MTIELEIGLYIFMLAGFLGYHLISRVPPLLHTPLMSATNAMSGISLVGSLVVAGAAYSPLSTAFGFVAVTCSTTNVVGGFLITDRMLRMFRRDQDRLAKRELGRGAWLAAAGLLAGVLALLRWREELRPLLRGADLTQALRFSYILSAALFILGLKGLSSPRHARQGMFLAELGMAMAVMGTLFHPDIVAYRWIIVGLILGSVVGASMGLWIPMTAVPQRTALSHSLGALAATLIGISEYIRHGDALGQVLMTTIGLEVVIGGLTFTGSLMAAAKLQGLLPGAPVTYPGQNATNFALLAVMVGSLVCLIVTPSAGSVFPLMVGLALLFGFLLVIPIGAADMPVVISLLNSYAGLADAAMGFALMNKIQIITGSLDGTSGFLLSLLMCRAMNRSAWNVLFGALAKLLMKRGIDVKYAIHPVAGRMPGHMNVLLAEANIPYDQLYEMEQINPYFGEADIALVVGANDVTNPAAKNNKSSPLYGMPILEVERAKSIIVLKRSMRPGFAGVDNDLYYNEKCMMLFGDAKESLTRLISEMKSLL